MTRLSWVIVGATVGAALVHVVAYVRRLRVADASAFWATPSWPG